MPRPVVWKRLTPAAEPGAQVEPEGLGGETEHEHPAGAWLDAAAFAGHAAPELTRRLGLKLGVRPLARAPEPPPRLIRLVDLHAGGSRLPFDVERAAVGRLLRRAMGGRAGAPDDPDTLVRQLAPSGASWQALSGLAAAALHAALSRSASLPLAPPQPTSRIAPPEPHERDLPAGQQLWVELVADGDRFLARLGLVAREERAQPPAPVRRAPAAEDRARHREWAERLPQALLAIECRVAIRIAEVRLPLDRLLALGPGDVLAIQRPRGLALSVEGQTLSSGGSEARPR